MLHRASVGMAAGTAVSRGTGLLRTVALAWALGVSTLGDAYNTANTAPNMIFALTAGGALMVAAALAGFAVSLVPFSLFQLLTRTSYAFADTRTPALVNVAVNGVP